MSRSNINILKMVQMIGFKRENPFSLDIPPISSSNSTPLTSPASMKAKEIFSFGSGRSFNLDFGNSTLRFVQLRSFEF